MSRNFYFGRWWFDPPRIPACAVPDFSFQHHVKYGSFFAFHQKRLPRPNNKKDIYMFFLPKCLFPDLIVWHFLMGARFLFNTFLMHVSRQDKTISSSSYISKPINVACAVHFWAGGTWGCTVWGKWRKEKKRSCPEKGERRVARVVLRVKMDMWWRTGTRWLWKAELAN